MTDQQRIAEALARGGTIDITTTGRTTGRARRIEIVFFNIDGRIYITGLPGKRDWLANLAAEPRLTFHLNRGVQADLPATARIIADADERRSVIEHVCTSWDREHQLEAFLAASPLIEIVFDDADLLAA